jgi:hypothetical protein
LHYLVEIEGKQEAMDAGIAKYTPLISGIALPLCLLFNLQYLAHLDHTPVLIVLAIVCAGIVTSALLLRMLEKKIKWTSRIMTYGTLCQGIFRVCNSSCFSLFMCYLGARLLVAVAFVDDVD